MILLIWETKRAERITDFKNLFSAFVEEVITLQFNQYAKTIADLRSKLFNNISGEEFSVLFAHTSNLVDKAEFLNIISQISFLYPTLYIILYTGGNINYLKDRNEIKIEDESFSFTPFDKRRVHTISARYDGTKSFDEVTNIKEAVEIFINTNSEAACINKILGYGEVELNKDLENFHFNRDYFKVVKDTKYKNVLFIWDKATNYKNEVEANIITDIAALNDFTSDAKNCRKYKAAVIIAEVWWGNPRSAFEGLSAGIELRKKLKFAGPLIFLSCLNINKFEELYFNYDIKFNILFAPATYLLKLSEDDNARTISKKIEVILSTAISLQAAALSDINHMLLNETGDLLDKLTHTLWVDKPMSEIRQVLNHCQKQYSNSSSYLTDLGIRLEECKKRQDDYSFANTKNELIQFVEQKFKGHSSLIGTGTLAPHKEKFMIVVVEDSIDYSATLKSKLQQRFQAVFFYQSDLALDYLKQDTNDKITCVISDWRLLKPGNKFVWQDMQGYQLLDELANFHPASLVSLTSEIDRNVHAIRNLLSANVTLFKKQHLQGVDADNTWNIFMDTIEELCYKATEYISSQPTGLAWKAENEKNKYISLKTRYMQARQANWPVFEILITQRATDYWNYYKQALSNVNPGLRAIDSLYGLTLNDNLEHILIVRRLWLALWFSKNKIGFIGNRFDPESSEISMYIVLKSFDMDAVSEDSHTNVVTPNKSSRRVDNEIEKKKMADTPYVDAWKRKLQTNASALTNTLCIVKSDLPRHGLLPEEKKWLKEQRIDFNQNAVDFFDFDDYEDD